MRTFALVVVGLLCVTAVAPTQEKNQPKKDPPKKETVAKLMAEKLSNSQLILEGLAIGDFTKITKGAEELMRISKAVEWRTHRTPQYEVQVNTFRQSLETIMAKSKAKNLDGATLGYVDLTVTCVRCHQHTRESRDTSLPLFPIVAE